MSFRDFFSRQARRPSGLFGRFIAPRIFDKGNRFLNAYMLDTINAQGAERILEIGFGTGEQIRTMADGITTGTVEGVDFSDAMLRIAARRNREHITSGKVRLSKGNFDTHDFGDRKFDKICSANTVYFWPDPAKTAARIHQVLAPGGQLVLAFVGKEKMDTMSLDMEVFTSYSPEDVCRLLDRAGFPEIETHNPKQGLYCVAAQKN